ncbi:uncharacterized protein LOC129924043 [Biomphalaria glabrata]|uniref:Uncharacterized protein LOC129924043 n=1 Tax=Biomphalaria glabrata TaxID=6526 RepID=A0A9W2ZF52_BIOGL|nr:uncharacterized protein LOC129924043 [Biomphalaria glabrata]
MQRKKMLKIYFLLVTGTLSKANDKEEFTSMGKRFVFSLPRLLHGDPVLTLCLTSYRNTTFSLRYEPPQGSLQTHSIKANETFSMEEIVRDKYDSAVGVRRSYILTSETPVEVVAFLSTDLSISSFKLLPVSSWGDKYYAVTAK